MVPSPLFMGTPGGIELLIAFVVWTVLPLVVVGLVLYYLHSIEGHLARLVELREE